jgi:hypothetical protein
VGSSFSILPNRRPEAIPLNGLFQRGILFFSWSLFFDRLECGPIDHAAATERLQYSFHWLNCLLINTQGGLQYVEQSNEVAGFDWCLLSFLRRACPGRTHRDQIQSRRRSRHAQGHGGGAF